MEKKRRGRRDSEQLRKRKLFQSPEGGKRSCELSGCAKKGGRVVFKSFLQD